MKEFFRSFSRNLKVRIPVFAVTLILSLIANRGGLDDGETLPDVLLGIGIAFVIFFFAFGKWPVLTVLCYNLGSVLGLALPEYRELASARCFSDWFGDVGEALIACAFLLLICFVLKGIFPFLGRIAFGMGRAAASVSDSIGNSVGNAVYTSMISSGRRDDRAEQARSDRKYYENLAAIARYDAIDAAKRGKDQAAYRNAADADYYDSMSRR